MSVSFDELAGPADADHYRLTVDWGQAACRNTDVNDFYATRGPALRRARQLCATCPVRPACLEQALTEEAGIERATFGYRGGLTAHQRVNLARREPRPTTAVRFNRDAPFAQLVIDIDHITHAKDTAA